MLKKLYKFITSYGNIKDLSEISVFFMGLFKKTKRIDALTRLVPMVIILI